MHIGVCLLVQWSVHFHGSREQETLPNASFDAFKPAMEAMRVASDEFMRRRVGLLRTGRTTYSIADEALFDPNLQLVIFAHNGSLLAWLSILLGTGSVCATSAQRTPTKMNRLAAMTSVRVQCTD